MNIKERFKLFKTYLEAISDSHKSYVKPLSKMVQYVLEAETGEQVEDTESAEVPESDEANAKRIKAERNGVDTVTTPDEDGNYMSGLTTIATMLDLQEFADDVYDYLSNPETKVSNMGLLDKANEICSNIDILIDKIKELDEEQDEAGIKSFKLGNAFDIIQKFPTLDSKINTINREIARLAKENMFIPFDTNFKETKEKLKAKRDALYAERKSLMDLSKPYDDIKAKMTVLANTLEAAKQKYATAAYSENLRKWNADNVRIGKNKKTTTPDKKEPETTKTEPETEEDRIRREQKAREAEEARLYDEAHPEEAAARKAQADMDKMQASLQERRRSALAELNQHKEDEEIDMAAFPSRKILYQIRDQIHQLVDENGESPIDITVLTPSYNAFVSSLQKLAENRNDVRTGLDLGELTSTIQHEFSSVSTCLSELIFPSDHRDDINLIDCDNAIETLSSLALSDDELIQLTHERMNLKGYMASPRENTRELGIKKKICENLQAADHAIEVILNICNNINKFKATVGKMDPIARKREVNDTRTLDSIDAQQLMPELQGRFGQLRDIARNDLATIKTMYTALQSAKKAKSTDLSAYLPEHFNRSKFTTAANGGYLYTIGDIEIPIRAAYEMAQPEENGVATSVQNDSQIVIMEQYTVKNSAGEDITTSKWNAVLSVDTDSIGIVTSFAGTFKDSTTPAIRVKMSADVDFVFVAMFKLLASVMPPVR